MRTVRFGEHEWVVKRADTPVGPGPNLFSDRDDHLWVDGDGLHLTVSRTDGNWYSTEVGLKESLGYGLYRLITHGRVDRLEPPVVFGMFTWDPAAAPHYRELDIELGRWGDPNNSENAQYVVQPLDVHRFRMVLDDAAPERTHVIRWAPNSVTFETWNEDQRLHEWTVKGPNVPLAGDAKLRLNLWLYKGRAPQQPSMVTIREFQFLKHGHRA